MSDKATTSSVRKTLPVSPSRVVAGLAHNPNVKRGEVGNGAVKLYLTNSGVSHQALQHLRSFGYEITAVNPRFNSIRCVPVSSSVVTPNHDSVAVEYHRARLERGGRRV